MEIQNRIQEILDSVESFFNRMKIEEKYNSIVDLDNKYKLVNPSI